MLIVYMMVIYLAAILLLSLLTYFTSLRITKVKQSYKQIAMANAFAVMASAVVAAALNVVEHYLPESLLLTVYKPLLTLALSVVIYGQFYSKRLQAANGQPIPARQGYMIATANLAIILILGLGLVLLTSLLKQA